MNPQRIRYVRAPDGTRIAFTSLGEGAPLVYVPSFGVTHLELEWQVPEVRAWYEGLAACRRLVRYDGRGAGLSDHDVADYSLDAQVGDLAAVIDAEGLEKVDLFGFYHGGPVAVAYAAHHPERVSRLLLWQTWAKTQDRFAGSPQIKAVRGLLDADFELFTETLAHTLMGWPEGDPAHRFAAVIRQCATPNDWQRSFAASDQFDVSTLLPQIQAPVLILHRRGNVRVHLDLARDMASRIPDSHLVLLEGASAVPYLGDMRAVLHVIDDFLASEPGDAAELSTMTSRGATVEPLGPHLSPREREVALLVAQGLTNRRIAEQLVITEGTATLHVKHVLAKLGFRSRAQIAAWAVQQGLTSQERV